MTELIQSNGFWALIGFITGGVVTLILLGIDI